MSNITTHVLDLARGVPAAGVSVTLAHADGAGHFGTVGRATTDVDGRVRSFGAGAGRVGRYRLTFRMGEYFGLKGDACFFPEVQLVFDVHSTDQRLHVPLLVSPYGYSTYRGS
jgi:5-hydroxyisourate hydrolase